MSSENKLLGKQILSVIDSLIEILILCLKKEGNDRELKIQGCHCVQELLELLQEFIGPHEEYLKEAIRELLKQRIPDHIMADSSDDIYNILAEFYQQVHSIASSPGVVSEEARKASEDILGKAIRFIFHRYGVIKDYKFRGQVFHFYLPELKLAVVDSSRGKNNLVNNRYLHKTSGIQVIAVDCGNLPCSREIAREIKRQLDTTRLSMLKL